jgi:hypothetical protein
MSRIAFAARCWLSLGLCGLLLGCGSSDGPTRYRVSGTVSFRGQPVPKGFITLEPDGNAGNSGPGGGAEIVNGRYNTGTEGGVVGGPYVVRIVGYDGVEASMSGETLPDGKPLFPPYETTFDFPKEPSTKDFEVP